MTVTDRAGSRMLVCPPRILAAWHRTGRSDLNSHLMVHGELRILRHPDANFASPLLEDVRTSGLTGRGGAGFPTARKWEALRRTRHPLVVVNAMEGEPASDKNRALLVVATHLVLDGAELAAIAVGAGEIVVCVPEDRPDCAQAVQDALDERAAAGIGLARSQVLSTPAGYVSGEESALVSWVGGADVKPMFRPNKAVPLRVKRRSALVHNVETLAHVALISRHGPTWFRSLGLPDAPGTSLVTLSGALERAGVYEVAMGEPIGSILGRAGLSAELGGVLIGGYGGAWIAPERIDTPYAPAPVAALGGTVGPGIIAALPRSSCGVAETARVALYMAEESAGQCGPCVNGLPAIASDLALLARGEGDSHILARLRQRLEIVEGRGACRHPDGIVRFVRSTLEVFAGDCADHARHRPCRGWNRRPVLRVRP